MKRKKYELTRGEEEVMQHVWDLKEATINDIIALMPEPKPKYTTVATFIKLLERKKYVDHYQMGKSFVYIPLVKKEAYAKIVMGNLINNYFDGSFTKMVSFYAENEEVEQADVEKVLEVYNGLKQ